MRQRQSVSAVVVFKTKKENEGRWLMGRYRRWKGGAFQSMIARLTLGSSSPLARLRWLMALSKASCTAFRRLEERGSDSLILSSVWSIPKGAILDLGSHCQLRLLSKKWTRKSFSADLYCIRSPALRTSSGGRGSSTALCWRAVFRTLGSMI